MLPSVDEKQDKISEILCLWWSEGLIRNKNTLKLVIH